MDFPIPENSSQLKRLPGFFAYNAKWIADYSNKVAPLLATQKQLAFPLNQASRLAIATLKKEVASAVLWLPRANEPLVLQTDASGTGIGATLTQNDKPVGFSSTTLKHSEWRTWWLNGKLWLSWKASAVSQTCYGRHGF